MPFPAFSPEILKPRVVHAFGEESGNEDMTLGRRRSFGKQPPLLFAATLLSVAILPTARAARRTRERTADSSSRVLSFWPSPWTGRSADALGRNHLRQTLPKRNILAYPEWVAPVRVRSRVRRRASLRNRSLGFELGVCVNSFSVRAATACFPWGVAWPARMWSALLARRRLRPRQRLFRRRPRGLLPCRARRRRRSVRALRRGRGSERGSPKAA